MTELIIGFLQGLVRQWPEIVELFGGKEPTEADWAAFKAKVSAKSYKDYVPDTKLPD